MVFVLGLYIFRRNFSCMTSSVYFMDCLFSSILLKLPANDYSVNFLFSQERQVKEIVLKAMGQAINKTVAIAEIIKRRVPRLHQDTAISSVSITDTFEPIEEGLQIVEQTRHVSMISITLSTKELNQNSPG
ncbi:uncharacterized protein LOC130997860 [Salvia miltiorrhiza]|uniref:uncharacterized protein LOC130997860 n=1 Tax=Salvia miltiorrhiza TaxID=226208 RepID=UPI0025AC7D76|nr:uncharacterized protein LOC130997860 [Salvia miltiorrhiza]